jgi:uncharacterized membrane protein YhaH (DUF805 family)
MKWFVKVLRQYADFDGRARRTEFWMYSLFWSLAAIAVLAVFGGLTAATDDEGYLDTGIYLLIGYHALTVVPFWAVTARRLHDIGQSGWLQVIAFIPLVAVVGALVILVMAAIDGNVGPNRYGPDPKAAERDPVEPGYPAGYPQPGGV